MWKIQQKQWNIRNKNLTQFNRRLPNIYIYKFGAISRQGLEIFYLVRFNIFEPYQSSKNKIKQLKTNEQQWKIMKKKWKPMKKNMKNTT